MRHFIMPLQSGTIEYRYSFLLCIEYRNSVVLYYGMSKQYGTNIEYRNSIL